MRGTPAGSPPRAAATVTLSDARAEADFARDGCAVVGLLSPAELDRLQAAFARHAVLHEGPFAASLLIPDAAARGAVHHAVQAVLAPALARVLAGYRSVFCGFAVKAPCTDGGEMPLHQDISFSRPEGRPAVSVWAPLVDVSGLNGCLVLVPGSHRVNTGARAPGSTPAADSLQAYAQAGLLRELPMRRGEAVVMDQRLLHASPGNRSQAVRAVATAVAVPAEEGLRYYHRSVVDGVALLEGFAVEDDFHLGHPLGSRPARGTRLGVAPERVDFIHPRTLAPRPGPACAVP